MFAGSRHGPQRFSPPAALDPAGPFAQPISDAAWALFAMGAVVFLLVLGALGAALFGGPRARRLARSHRLVVLGGLAAPIVVLSIVLVWGLLLMSRTIAVAQPNDLRIRVVGEMWWWRVNYLDGPPFETANEIRIPVGRPVAFELQSADVIHSFWVPRLGPKLDMIPGRTNILRLQATEPGVYRGQCTEFCGAAHALMAFEVVAMEPAAYAAWRARMAEPALASRDRGQALFAASGCGACHAVRGTPANGTIGPDLTHFAARRTLGAGVLSNDPTTLRAWLAHPAALKPGVRMPRYDMLPQGDLEAIARYLETLK